MIYLKLIRRLILLTLVSQGCCLKSFLFQESNIPSAESRAWKILNLSDEERGGIQQFTVALWFKIDFFRDSTYIFSYATSDKNNNELNMGITDDKLFVATGVKNLASSRSTLFTPGNWYHVAVSVNSDRKMYQIHINGKLDRKGSIGHKNLHLNGSLVLGQETDVYNGGFNDMQSFSGEILDFKLFKRFLTTEEVQTLTSCNRSQHLPGDLVNMEPLDQWSVSGEIRENEVSYRDICKNDESATLIFPDPFKFVDAVRFCTKIKSTIYAPRDAVSNRKIYDAVVPYADVCKPKNHATSFMWLGVTDAAVDGKWTDLEIYVKVEKPLNFTNFNSDGANKKQNCAAFEKPPDLYFWNDVLCSNVYNFCLTCHAPNKTIFKIRGLCEEKTKNSWFVFNRTMIQNKHSFRSFSKYAIELRVEEDKKDYWTLIDMWNDRSVVAKKYTHDKAYPFGISNWTVNQDYELCEKPIGHQLPLSFSACYDNEFTCNEGTCIDILKRCDLKADCPDSSDEIGCEKLVMPPEYISSLPPPGEDNDPLQINITIQIRSLSEIDILNMKITVDLHVKTSWFESRLKYKNLREIQDINYVNPGEVWIPQYDPLNANFPQVSTTDPKITVKRRTHAIKDDPSLHIHDEIFLGSENPLELTQKLNAPFSCEMDLKNFPFDIQYCHLLFQLSEVREDFAKWGNVEVYYLGEKLLTQYEVGTIRTGKKIEDLHSVAVVQIPLFGRFWFYVTASYLPILMLMIIGYASLFCKHESADLRIMMALTALLVLYALYQQISDGLPKTSYTKAVDIWCFFAITLIFSQVIYHVAIDVSIWPRFFMRRDMTEKEKNFEEVSVSSRRPNGEKLLKAARIFYVIIFLIFFVIYWSVVLLKKSNQMKKGFDLGS